ASTATILFLFGWDWFATWYITGSGFTDLPGQDSLQLVNTVGDFVYGVVAMAAGRLAGLLCAGPKWIAVLIATLPLNAFFLVSAGEHGSIMVWVACLIVCGLGFFGAYGPALLRRGERRGRPTRG
ncbi:MAG: hypothetical protein ACRET6_14020, partial [Burkholderiales bacterium]